MFEKAKKTRRSEVGGGRGLVEPKGRLGRAGDTKEGAGEGREA